MLMTINDRLEKSTGMSKSQWINRLLFSVGLLILYITATTALAPRAVGQQVVEGSENLLHLWLTDYPSSLREKGIQGTVELDAVLDERGHVQDARVISGPNQLRKLALMSVLDWHFAPPNSSSSTVRVAIQWKLPMSVGPNPKGLYKPGPRSRLLAPTDRRTGILKAIEMLDLRDPLKQELERRLPVQPGQRVEKDEWEKVQKAVVEVDEHLELKMLTVASQSGVPGLVLRIFHPRYNDNCNPPPPPPPPSSKPR